VLVGAAGALAVVAAETATHATSAQAANGDPVLQGADNGPTTSRTMVFTANSREFASLCDQGSHGKGSVGVFGHGFDAEVYGESAGAGVQGEGGPSGIGVVGVGGAHGNGVDDAGAGVKGVGGGVGAGVSGAGGLDNGIGVYGSGAGFGSGVSGTGGINGGTGVTGSGGANNGVGVVGAGGGSNGIGVWGTAQGTGAGVLGIGLHGPAVHGQANFADAIGVLAENIAGGVAFKAVGRASFSRSGVLTVRAGKSAVTKAGVALTSASLVLATLQENRAGVFVQSAVPDVAASSFTVHLSKAVTAATKVAWFIVN
jgi:hypothetical protein